MFFFDFQYTYKNPRSSSLPQAHAYDSEENLRPGERASQGALTLRGGIGRLVIDDSSEFPTML